MLNYILIFLIQVIRPLLGPACCKYPVSCTRYAVSILKEKPLLKAIYLIIRRVFSCNPFSQQFVD